MDPTPAELPCGTARRRRSFKAGGYRSFRNYISRIKDSHVMAGFPWTDLLQRNSQKCMRSVLRGLASPTRSEPFDLIAVYKVAARLKAPVTDGAPWHPMPLIVCATFFVLREIEGIQL
ncbi:unnamed protein product [Cladocopium goreaui]|uniref:Uncharacterized protein n=1 Tax=Cladocopium goreaui TaxID=2562237 RepID=A0A9P1BF44_9DINO|nr:unnamed protein product [Cladocopium goreaui]